jgi:hypothetical protein
LGGSGAIGRLQGRSGKGRRHHRLSALRFLNVLAGVALGALLQSSATAIAASFALPVAFALLGTASTLVSDWIDMSTTWNWVLQNDWAGHVPQISFSIVLWVAIPLAAGVARTRRRDVG